MKAAVAAGVLLAALSVTPSPAQPALPDTEPHLLLVPDTPEGTAALGRSDARTVARYESFSLVEAAGDDVGRLRRAGADRRDDMRTVATAAGAIDPTVDRAPLAAKDAPDRDRTLALVQFTGPPKDAWLERLGATGARLVGYQPENAYLVHARGDAVDRVAGLLGTDPAVRAVSVVAAADKLFDSTSPSGIFAVTSVKGESHGASLRAPVTLGAQRTEYLALSPAEAARLAADPGVISIQAHEDPQLLDERGAQIVAGDPTLAQPGYRDWLTAEGFTTDTFDFAIDVTDGGLDDGANPPAHPDFSGRVAYVANYTADSNARDCTGHGTNVASIAAGQGRPGAAYEDAGGFDHGLGVAPFARIGVSKYFDCNRTAAPTFDHAAATAFAYASGARISNNSWGSPGGDYTVTAALYDRLVRDASPDPGNQAMVEVLSAGNNGRNGYASLGNQATAKNVITVGASESVRASGTDGCGVTDAAADSARDIADFSSRGPTNDGRLKPDIVAPGTHITGAAPQHAGYTAQAVCNKFLAGTTWYSVVSGTSQAAPHVSGAAALVRRWHQRVHGSAPSPALTKALLVNTATDLGGGDDGKGSAMAPGPNHEQGWGRVNLGNVFDGTARDLRDQVDTLTASGDRRLRSYAVDDPAAPVKVTLAWTDAPGTSTANPVVNDLDLVVDVGGQTYKGNVFDGALSRTGGSADPRNNLESVYLPAGTTGGFAVKVVGTGIAGDGVPGNADTTDQDYALVVSNAEPAPAALLSHDATTLDTSIGAGGDGDGALEPGETFALDERLANAGEAAAGTVRGTLTSPSLTMTQGSSQWLDLAPGQTGTSLYRFAGALASDAACGADVSATLSLTTAGGPQTVPLTVPTGVAGQPVARTTTLATRLAIPDDNATGVTSTIEVPTAGRIKDLDVRIADIDHPWVGDLRIDITGPDGTTVNLVNQPGGPENLGDDFVSTVFDDEAATAIARQAPYTGRFRPQNDQLSRFDGKQQQGVWTLRVRDLVDNGTGTLGAWGTDTSPATCSVATVTRIDSGPVGGSSDADFTFSSDIAGARFECSLDGDDFAPCTSPTSYAGLLEGAHEFEVRAVVGPQQQVDPTPARHTWTIDLPPDTAITASPSGRVASAAASFRFGAPGATFECSLDGAAFAACASPHAYDGLADGEHSFRVRARDGGGVDATPASRTWTVDTTAPAPTVRVDGTTIAGTAGTSPGDSETVGVTVYAGGTPVRTLTTARDAAGTWSVEVALDPGDYTVRAEQADDAVPANIGSAEAAFEIAPDPIVVPHGPPADPPATQATAPPAIAPSFLIASRTKVLAACASACTLKAGGRTISLPGEGTAVVKVKRRAIKAGLTVGGRVLTLNRRVRPGRRLRLWAVASERCRLSAAGREVIAGPDTPVRLDLRRARRVVVEAGTDPKRTATLTLR